MLTNFDYNSHNNNESKAEKQVSFEEAQIYLAELDLSYVVNVMCSDRYPLPRWSIDNAWQCCQLYKNFLLLQKKHLPTALVPTREIDEFWHNHILYTKRYWYDCMRIFGHYLHHEPASSLDDPKKLINAFLMTKEFYLLEFKKPLGLIEVTSSKI